MHFAAPSIANFALRGHWSLGIAAAIIIPLVAMALISQRLNKRRSAASQSWPSVTGCVSKFAVKNYEDNSELIIYYDFVVNNTSYWAKRYGFGKDIMASDEKECKRIQEAEWPIGKPVTVYYDPKYPFNAALDRSSIEGRTEDTKFGLGLIGLLVLYAALIDFGVIRFN